MTTLNITSTGMIYSPGIFQWVMETIAPFDQTKAKELLAALNIPQNLISKILKGKYRHRIEGETLVLMIAE